MIATLILPPREIWRLTHALTPEQRRRVVHVAYASFDTYIGRQARWGNPRWGNPLPLKDYPSRLACLDAYIDWLASSERGMLIQSYVSVLAGRTLGCHCRRPGQDVLCHGLVLVALAENSSEYF